MIEVKDLSKRFEGGEALCGVSLKVKVGEICAVAGKEGSGRTTLTDILSGCIEPDAGQIVVCGADMEERPGEAKRHLGYVPAETALYRDMTPRAGMKFIADARGLSGRESSEMIDRAIKQFRLKDVADTQVRNLGAGVRRLVALAQATFAGAEAVVIDEPTAGLNPAEILEMRQAIRSLREDHAVLLTSKNLTELCDVADRVLVLRSGKIVAEGTPDQLHRLTMNDGSLRMTVRGAEDAVRSALASVKGAEIADLTADGGECSVVLKSKDGADLREAAFKAIAGAQMTLLYMAPGTKPMDELLAELTYDRLSASEAPEKEENGDEGHL